MYMHLHNPMCTYLNVYIYSPTHRGLCWDDGAVLCSPGRLEHHLPQRVPYLVVGSRLINRAKSVNLKAPKKNSVARTAIVCSQYRSGCRHIMVTTLHPTYWNESNTSTSSDLKWHSPALNGRNFAGYNGYRLHRRNEITENPIRDRTMLS